MADTAAQPIAVTGATGALGSRVARGLAERGIPMRLIVRDAARAPRAPGAEVAVAAGYHDRASFTAALRGASTLFLVSARRVRRPGRRARRRGGRRGGRRRAAHRLHLVPRRRPGRTFTFARDHHATEEHIRGTRLSHTFLRNSMYAEYVPLSASAEGVIAGPAGDGRVAWVSRDDVAAAAVEALTATAHDGVTYELTGPEAHSFALGGHAALRRGRRAQCAYVDETLEQAYAARARYGAPRSRSTAG